MRHTVRLIIIALAIAALTALSGDQVIAGTASHVTGGGTGTFGR